MAKSGGEDSAYDSALPDTQGCSTDHVKPESVSDLETNIWGRLFSIQDGFYSLDLIKETYTFGRFSTCDVVYGKELKDCELNMLSKIHFHIERDVLSNTVRLLDKSTNGTYINEALVGRGQMSCLETNDQISLAVSTNKTYIFVGNPNNSQSVAMPPEVTNRYVVSRALGSGAFGEVRLIFHKETKARYALKTVMKFRDGIDQSAMWNEAKLLMELNHPCIIKVITTVDTVSSLHIILELMDGGDLLARKMEVGRFLEPEARFIIYQIALGVKYLHDKNISHRDLKMENILLAAKKEYPQVKVADFGLSRKFSESLMKTYCGTPLYLAPEILTSCGSVAYKKEVDIWSLGVISYVCLSGEHPFKKASKPSEMSLEQQIIRGVYCFPKPLWEGITAQAIDIVKKMMTTKPNERLNVSEVLGHSWLMNDTMKKKVHLMLGISSKRPTTSNENVVPNRRKK